MGEIMNKDQFAGQIFLIFEDRSLKLPSVSWIEALYTQVAKFSDEQIAKGLDRVMKVSAEEWNKKYGFGGKPAISDWIEYLSDTKTLTTDKEASIEADRIINHAEYYYGNDTLFENAYTNACVKTYGGLGKIKFQLFDSLNPKPSSREWIHKEIKRIWIDCFDGKKRDTTPCIGNSSVKKEVVVIGDKVQRLALGVY
jgi:hypothetical protein